MKLRCFSAALLLVAISTSALAAVGDQRERPLNTLERQCKEMLDLHRPVLEGMKSVARTIEGRADKKPGPKELQTLRELSGKVKDSIKVATKAIKTLEDEGSAVAFHEVFLELREDMKRVQRRLESGDVSKSTQTIQEDVVDTLQELIRAPR